MIVNQSLYFSDFPLTISKNFFCRICVIGPLDPLPIDLSSNSLIGVTSAAVPVKKASSEIYI